MSNSTVISERLPSIHLYQDLSAKTLDLFEIARCLEDKFGKVPVEVRGPFIKQLRRIKSKP
ncbi:MAG: hypothetical protein QMC89_04020 [Candidatus Hodarchaeaceae archaeon]|nr:hypothetical protein [Candidatus Hodarchaeaceae archaeon]